MPTMTPLAHRLITLAAYIEQEGYLITARLIRDAAAELDRAAKPEPQRVFMVAYEDEFGPYAAAFSSFEAAATFHAWIGRPSSAALIDTIIDRHIVKGENA